MFKEISFLKWCCLVDGNFIFDAFCEYTDELNYCTKIKNLLNAGADISSLNDEQKKLLKERYDVDIDTFDLSLENLNLD